MADISKIQVNGVVYEIKDQDELRVTIDTATGKASHTAGQIFEARNAGQDVIASINDSTLLNLLSVDATYAVFCVTTDEPIMHKYLINDTGTLEYYEEEYATSSVIGDIEAALDELHAYAQGLADGGAAE